MLRGKYRKIAVALVILGLWLTLPVNQAQAVPSFARQTGLDCSSCHTIFPELTPVGRNFKMNGYTASKHSDKPYEWPPPLWAAFLTSFTHINKSLPNNVLELDNRANDNINFPQEIAVFYAGRILPYFGAFIQGLYDGVGNKFSLDHTDIRPSVKITPWGKDLVLGITVNNAPGVQDVLNTTPAFGFPWASSDVALTPSAQTVLDGRLDFQVGGTGVYAYWNNLLYAELTLYRTSRTGFHQLLGAGTLTDTRVDGLAPYWRVFLQHQWKQHSLAVGTIGMITRIFPGEREAIDVNGNPILNLQYTSGPSDKFTDIAVDAQYQFIGKKHIITAQTIWITEFQHWQASFALGDTTNRHDRLNTYKLNLNYYYRTSNWGTIGGTGAFFATWGTKDDTLYAPNPGDGSRTGKPNSNGFILEASYLPLKYSKFTLQYTIYNKFNGATSNYDGFDRKASNNNTLFLLAWFVI